jgi:hypothetical protein
MKLPPSVSRLIARLAFLASLLFAVGSGPTSALTTLLVSAGSEAGALDDREEEDVKEEVALHRQTSREEEQSERAACRQGIVRTGPPVAKAIPFTPAHRVTRAPPRPPYRPLLRMLC